MCMLIFTQKTYAYTYSNNRSEHISYHSAYFNGQALDGQDGQEYYMNNGGNVDNAWMSGLTIWLSGDYQGDVIYNLHCHDKGWTHNYTSGNHATWDDGTNGPWYGFPWVEALTAKMTGDVGNYYYMHYVGRTCPITIDYLKTSYNNNLSSTDMQNWSNGMPLWYQYFSPGTVGDNNVSTPNGNGSNWVGTHGYSLPLTGLGMWIVKYPVTLNINPNGGNVEGNTNTYAITGLTADGTVNVSTPTRQGYEFTGWSISYNTYPDAQSSNTTNYQRPSSDVSPNLNGNSIYLGNAKDIAITANWRLSNFNLKFEKNLLPFANASDLSGWVDSKVVTYGQTYGSLPQPSLSGASSARFDGWFTAPVGGSQIVSTTIYNQMNDSTLYAHWSDITPPTIDNQSQYGWYSPTYTLTFNTNDVGGSGLSVFELHDGGSKSGTLLANGGINGVNGSLTYNFSVEDAHQYTLLSRDNSGNETVHTFLLKLQHIQFQASISKISGDTEFSNNAWFSNTQNTYNNIGNCFGFKVNPVTAPLQFTQYGNMTAYLFANIDFGYVDSVTYKMDARLNALGVQNVTHNLDNTKNANTDSLKFTIPSGIDWGETYWITISILRNGEYQEQKVSFQPVSLDLSKIHSSIVYQNGMRGH